MAITLRMRTTISPGSLALIGAHQHGICIVVAAIFDFITEEEWGERGRLRVGGEEGGGETTNSQQQNFIDVILKWVTSENKTIHKKATVNYQTKPSNLCILILWKFGIINLLSASTWLERS